MFLSHYTPNTLRMRPLYNWHVQGEPTDLVRRLCEVCSFDPAVNVQCGEFHAVLHIPPEARHTWSPTIDVQVRSWEDGTHVHAIVGPEAPVWTFFLFMYVATLFPCVIGSVLGMVQYTLDQSPVGLLAIPAWLAAWGLIYGASFVGKGLGKDQTHQLLAVLNASLGIDPVLLDS